MTAMLKRNSGYVMRQLEGPVIMDHSDMPPMPASRESGRKIVVMKVRRRTERLVRLAARAISLLRMDKSISIRLVATSRSVSVNSKNRVR